MPQLNNETIGVLRDLAEGRLEPHDWLAWWDANRAAVEAAVSPGVFLALKPRGVESNGAESAALGSQAGACKALDQLKLDYSRSDRYKLAWQEQFRMLLVAEKEKKAKRAKEFKAGIARFEAEFPGFGKFLKTNTPRIEELGAPISDEELQVVEMALRCSLPDTFVKFLRCAQTLIVDNVLEFTTTHPFVHHSTRTTLPTEGMLCIADFRLEDDGDQLLIDIRGEVPADPPVLYYSHGAPGEKLRALADSFTAWIESLPRTLAE